MNICRSNDLQNSMTYIELLFKNIKVKGEKWRQGDRGLITSTLGLKSRHAPQSLAIMYT